MDYKEATDYVLSFTDYEKLPSALYSPANFDLRRVEDLLHRLRNPHLFGKTIHVAGTKGKGSTSAMMASALTACGHTTGLFTSPHLHTMRERIRVGKVLISEGEVASLVQRMKEDIEEVNRQATYGQLTTFEILTALAFLYFKEREVAFLVMEAGMGGRLDATNVVQRPEVCVLTSISLDHTEILGRTLARIASEKAGIVKEGSTVVSAPQAREAMEVIERLCVDQGARLVRVGREVGWELSRDSFYTQEVRVRGRLSNYEFSLPLLGEHQGENAAIAIAALEVLREKGVELPEDGIERGMSEVNWPGRLQVLWRSPLVVVDGAHNPASARRLREALFRYFAFSRAVLVLGTSVDKDAGGILRELAPLFSSIVVTSSQHPRATPCDRLKEECLKLGIEPLEAAGLGEAISSAVNIAGKGDLVCITGSLFVVAEAIEMLDGLPPQSVS